MPRIACMRLWPPIAEQPLPGASPSSSTPMSSSIFIVRSTAGAGRCRTDRVLHWLGVTRIHRFRVERERILQRLRRFVVRDAGHSSSALSRGPQPPTIPAITEKAVGELIVPRCDGAIDLEVAEHDNCHTCDWAVNPLIFRAFGWRRTSDVRNAAKCRDGPDSDIKTRGVNGHRV